MLKWLKRFLRRNKTYNKVVAACTPKSAYDKIVEDICATNRCPCCEQDNAWLAGPQGGMSENIMCQFCGMRLNTTGMYGHLHLDWTHGPQEDIWGGKKATQHPSEEKATLVQVIIERENVR